jgi:hypothetical protein
MNSVVIRRSSRIQIDTPRGPTRSYSPAAARCIAMMLRRPILIEAILPYLQDADPYLASALAALSIQEGPAAALFHALVGAADQLAGAGEQTVRLTTPAPVSGTDGQSSTMSGDLEVLGGEDLADLDGRD